jgi:hypothetical protein
MVDNKMTMMRMLRMPGSVTAEALEHVRAVHRRRLVGLGRIAFMLARKLIPKNGNPRPR